MNESEFNDKVDQTLMDIEDAIEEAELDIDYDTAAGILTLVFENDSKVIINRQTPLKQLWVAAKSGGYHLNYVKDDWVLESGAESLYPLLNRVCTEQSDDTVVLEPPHD
jgi:CyaY protein